MKIAYLILAHNSPNNLERIIKKLEGEDICFFIHLDRKSDISEFSKVKLIANCKFIEDRVKVFWGDFSQNEAILNLIRFAIRHSDAERLVLISGSDYPICCNTCIQSFFNSSKEKEFIKLFKIPDPTLGKPESRLNGFRFRPNFFISNKTSVAITKLVNVFIKRNYQTILPGIQFYGGGTWWALTRSACEYIEEFISNNPKFIKFMEHTHCSDEMLIHTILGSSERIRAQINNEITFTDWSLGGSHPAEISSKHLTQLKNDFISNTESSEFHYIFARKFTENSDALDFIDSGFCLMHSNKV
jgi:hypothetical protein